MTTISAVTLDATDVAAARAFYDALGLSERVRVREASAPQAGFRGFTLSLVVSQPGVVDAYVAAALAAGGREVKPAKKSFWGYGGVVAAPDGALWKFACSAKKNSGPSVLGYEQIALLLGVDDVKAAKQSYADQGLGVEKSYGSKYVQFESGDGITLGLYQHAALAKDAGVPAQPRGERALQIEWSVAGAAQT